MDGITDIITGGITIDITITGTTIGTGTGLSASIGACRALSLLVNGLLCASRSPLFEIARVLVRFDHVARFIVNANHKILLFTLSSPRSPCSEKP